MKITGYHSIPPELSFHVAKALGNKAVEDKEVEQGRALHPIDAAKVRANAIAKFSLVFRIAYQSAPSALRKTASPEEARAATRMALKTYSKWSNEEFRRLVKTLLEKYRHIEVPYKDLSEEQKEIISDKISKSEKIESVHLDAALSMAYFRAGFPSGTPIQLLFSRVKRMGKDKPENFEISIDLSQNDLDGARTKHVADALIDPDCKIKHCNLSGNSFDLEGVRHIAGALKHPDCQLQSCDLSNNTLGPAGAQHIADALKHPDCQLQNCDLSDNEFGPMGAQHIADALKHPDCKLQSCNLSHNELGPEGAQHIADALMDADCRLQECDLRANSIEAIDILRRVSAAPDCKTKIIVD